MTAMGKAAHPAYGVHMEKLGAKRFRKRPVEVYAIQWTGNNFDEIERFAELQAWLHKGPPEPELSVDTLEGVVYAKPGVWIVKGVKGEHYPCRPDVFELTYEVAE